MIFMTCEVSQTPVNRDLRVVTFQKARLDGLQLTPAETCHHLNGANTGFSVAVLRSL